MDNPSLEVNGKTVVISGDFSLESVEDKIVALGHTIQNKPLGSQPGDWIKIEKDLKQLYSLGELQAVLFFLSTYAVIKYSASEYLNFWRDLLLDVKQSHSLLFLEGDCFQENTLLSHEGEMMNRCLHYINSNLELFIKLISNNDHTNDMKIISEINSIGLLAIDKSEYRVVLDYTTEKQIGSSIAILKDIDSTINDLFLRTKHILSEINAIKIVIFKSIDLKNLEKALSNITMKEKEIEPLFEKLQRDLVEYQTEQSQRVNQLLKIFQESGVEIVPYKERKEISLRVHHFLDEIDKGLFLHLYVPNGRYQEDQLAGFLRLFESYLQRVERLHVSIDTRRTLHGKVYEFKSKNTTMSLTDMEVAFSRFGDFMSLCQNDLKNAEALLLRAGYETSEASRLLAKYMKEYRRLLFDTEQERKRKMLDIGLRLESEIFDLTDATGFEEEQAVQPSALLSLPHIFNPMNITISNSSVIINSDIQSYIEQAIYGDIHYTSEDKQLIDLFEKHAERLESVLLRSDLDQLKDTSSSEVERKTAKQKIVGFLSKVAPAISQSALDVLTAYLQKVLTGS